MCNCNMYVNMHACVDVWVCIYAIGMYTCRYVYRQTYMSLYTYAYISICVAQGWFMTIYLWCSCTGCSLSITKLVGFHLLTFFEDINLFWSAEDGHTVWSGLWSWSFVSEKQHPNNNRIYHLTPYNALIISEINNILI